MLQRRLEEKLLRMDVRRRRRAIQSLRAYSFVFDRYLNAILRKTPLPRYHLQFSERMFEWELDSNEFEDESLIRMCRSVPPSVVSRETLWKSLPHIYLGLKDCVVTTRRQIRVYRSVVLDRVGKKFAPRFRGFTSCARDVSHAVHNSSLNLDMDVKRVIVMEITLPVGTEVIPMMCSRYYESELIIASQGSLVAMSWEMRRDIVVRDEKFWKTNSQGTRTFKSGRLLTHDRGKPRGVYYLRATLNVTGTLPVILPRTERSE